MVGVQINLFIHIKILYPQQIVLMLAHRLRRWPIIKPALVYLQVFAG